MVYLLWTTPTKESLVTSSDPQPAEGSLVAEGPPSFVFAPRALMTPSTVPTLILDLVLTFAFNRGRIPSGARPLLVFFLGLDLFFLLLLDHHLSRQFLLCCHQLMRLAITAILHLKAKPSITSLNLLLDLLRVQSYNPSCMIIKIRRTSWLQVNFQNIQKMSHPRL